MVVRSNAMLKHDDATRSSVRSRKKRAMLMPSRLFDNSIAYAFESIMALYKERIRSRGLCEDELCNVYLQYAVTPQCKSRLRRYLSAYRRYAGCPMEMPSNNLWD